MNGNGGGGFSGFRRHRQRIVADVRARLSRLAAVQAETAEKQKQLGAPNIGGKPAASQMARGQQSDQGGEQPGWDRVDMAIPSPITAR
ncbi:hypothetical protein HMSSN139_63200 [Paenibacillus sp. HMSSN-139]|nr:hypothetical protein HMSSN139_63200 [Paenibacillus sp. HMSSN-139]